MVVMGGTGEEEKRGRRGPSMNNDNSESYVDRLCISDSGGGN